MFSKRNNTYSDSLLTLVRGPFAMLTASPSRSATRASARRSRAPLKIYAPPETSGAIRPVAPPVAPRTGEVQPIGQLLVQVLERYQIVKNEG